MTINPVTPTIPLDENGIRHGFLHLPHSRNDSAWGSVMIPFSVICNGNGPTALLTGGNHGDEYEGPIALQDLAANVKLEEVSGRIIILPMMNHPAFLAGARCSPIDGVNLNRTFPGKAGGTISEKIANYIATELVPLADVVLDFHSGGKTLDFLPFAAAHVLVDKKHEAACMAAMQAFNAPYSCRMLEIDNVGMFDTEVERQGKVFVTTELGGAGTSSARTVSIAKRGVVNLLRHAGVLSGEPEIGPTTKLDMPDATCFHFAENAGLIEFTHDLGSMVEQGDMLAKIWPMDRTGVDPKICFANRSGILAARHVPGLLKMGDFIGLIADVLEAA